MRIHLLRLQKVAVVLNNSHLDCDALAPRAEEVSLSCLVYRRHVHVSAVLLQKRLVRPSLRALQPGAPQLLWTAVWRWLRCCSCCERAPCGQTRRETSRVHEVPAKVVSSQSGEAFAHGELSDRGHSAFGSGDGFVSTAGTLYNGCCSGLA